MAAAGALHQIMVKGIEGREISENDSDRDHFVWGPGEVLQETKTKCYAWPLIPNHFHMLLRAGHVPILTGTRRLLTGYAIWHNRTHGEARPSVPEPF